MPTLKPTINRSRLNMESFPEPPDVILIIGTDASGKNYVADLISDLILSGGYEVEKREGWFSGAPADTVSEAHKSGLSLLAEKGFIATFGLTKYFMPVLLANLIRIDLLKFRKPGRKVIVVSHSAIRILAFYLGHAFPDANDVILPLFIDRILRTVSTVTGAGTIVLDIEDRIRKERIARRIRSKNVDPFDHYMAADGILSERIENILIRIAETYFNAFKINNNDLEHDDLIELVRQSFLFFQKNR